VQQAFGTKNVEVFTDSAEMVQRLRTYSYERTALLMMSSGTFDGVDVRQLAEELLQ